MTDWSVRLDGQGFDLEDLAMTYTTSQANVTREEDGSYWLRCDDWALLAEDAVVLKAATQLLRRLNGASRVANPDYRSVQPGPVRRVGPDGQKEQVVYASCVLSARGRLVATVVVFDQNGSEAPGASLPPPAQDWASIARDNVDTDEVLSLFGESALSWFDLYKITEIVQHATGAPLWELPSVTRDEIRRFKQTANNSATGIDARHARSGEQPAKVPMELDHARALMRRVVRAWLETLRGCVPNPR